MGVLERSPKQKIILSTFATVLIIAALLFAGLMIWQATHLAGPGTVTRSRQVAIGPLHLAQLTKNPISRDAYKATIQVSAGLWIYAIVWICLATAIAYARIETMDYPRVNRLSYIYQFWLKGGRRG